MADNNQGGLLGRIRGNAEWEFIKFIGGSSVMTSIWQVCIASIHHVRPDWLMWDAVFGLGIALAGIGYWRQRRALIGASPTVNEPKSPLTINSSDDASEADRQAFNDAVKELANRHNTGEVLRAGVQFLDMFSPLQRETFQIAYELRQFLSMAGKRPVPQRDGHAWLPDGTMEWLIARNNVETPWVLHLVHSYADKYAAKVKHAMHELGAAGLAVWPLAPYTEAIIDESNIMDAADILEKMALEVGALQRGSKA